MQPFVVPAAPRAGAHRSLVAGEPGQTGRPFIAWRCDDTNRTDDYESHVAVRQPRYLRAALEAKTGGFASPPYGGFALRIEARIG